MNCRKERVAVDRMIQLFVTGAIELTRSKYFEAEIAAIPDVYRAPHEAPFLPSYWSRALKSVV